MLKRFAPVGAVVSEAVRITVIGQLANVDPFGASRVFAVVIVGRRASSSTIMHDRSLSLAMRTFEERFRQNADGHSCCGRAANSAEERASAASAARFSRLRFLPFSLASWASCVSAALSEH